ncbi:SusD/RagB family nutrient-binding outer membrane lipoprotein [uncultured Chryseobacterium sp.]|uniref:SusD/RagB family nutrient-binding outer membrane lipoprotein n=1 Tax=uncultured Chryseobacterium sp. TaxID=259322 RepID=UPI0025DB5C45|nr:SusD/RagB family nutrient-binding outer membrane lipoprotein [uncultured Chryseobacterium sp.]
MKKIKFLMSIIVCGVALSSCNNYLDINENPNNVHQENLTPQLIFPGAVSQTYRTQGTTMLTFGNIMMNSWAGNTYAYGGPFASEYTLNSVNSSFYSDIWDGIYPNIANFAFIENYPNADGKQDNYIAAAKIMKAYYMQYLVDLYGDVPYSEAFKGQNNLTPKYDDDVAIYKALINDMDVAKSLIANAKPTALSMGAADIVFAGNMSSWTNFANTIKFKLLMRMSNVTGDLATYRDTQLATLASAPFISADVFEKPGYAGTSDAAMHPTTVNYFINAAISAYPQNYTLITASENLAAALNGNNLSLPDAYYQKYNGLPDPRRFRLFLPYSGGTVVRGIRQGATPGQPGAPNDNTEVSKLSYFMVGSNTGTLSQVIKLGNDRGGLLMSLAELNLLKAEAALRYPAIFPTFDGLSSFNLAVTQSGKVMNADTQLSMASYITQISTRPGLGWVGTTEQKYEAIMTQKWILLTQYNPTEMYIEYNRLGQKYPFSPMATTATRPNKPLRLVYPTSEYVGNSANVPNVTSAEVFTKNSKTPFWNQN